MGHGQDTAALDAVGPGDGLHLHTVGDDEAGVAKFAAEQVGQDTVGQRRRAVRVQGRDQDVGGHHGAGAGGDGRAERGEFPRSEQGRVHVNAWERVVGVDGGVAVAREVLGAGRHARGLQAGDVGGGVAGDQFGGGAEGADTDDRVGRVGVHVGRRGPVEVDPAGRETAPQLGGHLPGQFHVVHRAQGVVAGEGRTGPHLQTGDVAALLVDRDQDVVAFGAQLCRQDAQLLG